MSATTRSRCSMFASSISAPASRISAGSTIRPLTAVLHSACSIGVSPAMTSYTVGVFSFTRTPRPLDVLPCGSASTTSTRLPSAATQADRLTLVVVLPTPPFWFVIAMILAMISPKLFRLPVLFEHLHNPRALVFIHRKARNQFAHRGIRARAGKIV